jgi:hypothetical protein
MDHPNDNRRYRSNDTDTAGHHHRLSILADETIRLRRSNRLAKIIGECRID